MARKHHLFEPSDSRAKLSRVHRPQSLLLLPLVCFLQLPRCLLMLVCLLLQDLLISIVLLDVLPGQVL